MNKSPLNNKYLSKMDKSEILKLIQSSGVFLHPNNKELRSGTKIKRLRDNSYEICSWNMSKTYYVNFNDYSINRNSDVNYAFVKQMILKFGSEYVKDYKTYKLNTIENETTNNI